MFRGNQSHVLCKEGFTVARELTPEQQAALVAFEEAASNAADAKDLAATKAAELVVAQQSAEMANADNLAKHQLAVDKAVAFVELMVPGGSASQPPPPNPPAPPQSAKGR